MSVREEVVVSYAPKSWWEAVSRIGSNATHARVLSGSVVMLAGSTFVSLVNFAYNLAVARMLGPAAFSHAAAAVTLLMLVSAITLAFQLTCAKFVARNEAPGARSLVYRTLLRRAWAIGIPLGGALALFSGPVAAYLRLPSAMLVVVMAVGIAFYVPLGVRRGGMQGTCEFGKLSGNLALEALVKLLTAVTLVHLGYGVMGAVTAISASVVLAYTFPWVSSELHSAAEPGVPASLREGLQAIVFFVGQVLINNIDILMVKHFFRPSDAGLYAAIALVGRVLYFASWSVVSAMFPISAGAKPQEENYTVLVVPLLFVAGISAVFTVFLGFFPDFVLRMLFGPGFNAHNVTPLLSLYAATTGVYALAVVLTAYEISRRIANVAWLQLAFSLLVVLGIALFHGTLREVIVVQQVLMVLLLISVSVPFFRKHRRVVQEAL